MSEEMETRKVYCAGRCGTPMPDVTLPKAFFTQLLQMGGHFRGREFCEACKVKLGLKAPPVGNGA